MMMRAMNSPDRRLRQVLTAAVLAVAPAVGLAQPTPVDVDLEVRTPDNSIPRGDFGDAPDGERAGYQAPYHAVVGNFPTRHATANSRYGLAGGHTLRTQQAWLGLNVSEERGARDTLDPDTVENLVDDDRDDSLAFGPCVQGVPSLPVTSLNTTLGIDVTVAAGAPAQTRYLNVLIDLNHDGVWADVAGITEWVAIDVPVNVTPGTTQTITVGPYVNLLDPAASWTRIALTNTPVSGSFADDGSGWDGSGQFSHGEIEDYLIDNTLVAAYAWMYAADSDSDIDTDLAAALAIADPPDATAIVSLDANAHVTAVAAALAIAQAEATASAGAVAAAQASAAAAAAARSSAEASAAAIASACISCPCATLCASAGASATAAVDAAVRAQAAADAAVLAAVAAEAQASAQVLALTIAVADLNVQVSAFAAARASAIAAAGSFASSYASATASAQAYASAYAAAVAATCSGDATTFATAMADAYAHAYAAASARADAWAFAAAAASAWSEARVSIQIMARTETLALAYASASSYAGSAALAFAATASEAEAAGAAAALSLTDAFAVVVGSCGGDCCEDDHTTTSSPDRYRNGVTTRSSVRTGTSVRITLLGYTATGAEITGFTWQGAEPDPATFGGVGDFWIYDAGLVQSGLADPANAMFNGQAIPVNRNPVLDDCGNPVQMNGMPLFNYEMNLPIPVPTFDGEDLYFGVAAGGAPGYDSRMVSSHTDPENPSQPSYFISPQEGLPTAVPVSSIDDCDHDYVAAPTLGAPGGTGMTIRGDDGDGHDHSRKAEVNQRRLLRSLATGTSGGTQD